MKNREKNKFYTICSALKMFTLKFTSNIIKKRKDDEKC